MRSSATDKTGRMELDSLLAGEYALAWRTSAVGEEYNERTTDQWTIRPNPASDHVIIDTGRAGYHGILRVIDAGGKTVLDHPLSGRSIHVPLNGLAMGKYTLILDGPYNNLSPIGSLVIGHR